jgi:uncharacterized protein YkwD
MRFVIPVLILLLSPFAEARGGTSTALSLINTLRISGSSCRGGGGVRLGALRFNATLARAARQHALNMGSGRFVSHYYKGVGPRTRVARAGYRYSRMSEIIFLGGGGASRAVRWWKNSTVHCRAMTNPHYLEFGAAQYNGAWVVVMARRVGR